MNGKDMKGCIFRGNTYKFKIGDFVGEGGNGVVYNAMNLFPSEENEYVVKILNLERWNGRRDAEKIKNERFERFKKEIQSVLKLQEKISRIMRVDDYYFSDERENERNAWYLMRKAKPFHYLCNKSTNLTNKLKYLIELSEILCSLHNEQSSHRDIKLRNLLFLDRNLVLSDFGLIWTIGDEIITSPGERIGPSFIRPPELEQIDLEISDYRPSDVYLLAKVVWMVIKGDNWGFRSQYKRSNLQFYLRPEEFKTFTFEPIHHLLERATEFDMGLRISIKECRDLLKQQLEIVKYKKDKKNEWIIELRKKELEQEAVNQQASDGLSFSEPWKIQNILKKVLPMSISTNSDSAMSLTVKVSYVGPMSILTNRNSEEKMKIDSFVEWEDNDSLILQNHLPNNEIMEYLCYPKEIKHNKKKGGFELHLKSFTQEDKHKGFATYTENRKLSLGPKNKKILLNQEIILHIFS